MADQQTTTMFVPTRIEDDVEPTGEPIENLQQRRAKIEQHLGCRDATLDLDVDTFEIGQKRVEEHCGRTVLAIHVQQILLKIRETRIVGTQRPQERTHLTVAGKLQP